ncbi:hypothetical protein MAR_030842, partial [Mya arenaria]
KKYQFVQNQKITYVGSVLDFQKGLDCIRTIKVNITSISAFICPVSIVHRIDTSYKTSNETNSVVPVTFLESQLEKIPLKPNRGEHLKWWLHTLNTSQGESFHQVVTHITIQTKVSQKACGDSFDSFR